MAAVPDQLLRAGADAEIVPAIVESSLPAAVPGDSGQSVLGVPGVGVPGVSNLAAQAQVRGAIPLWPAVCLRRPVAAKSEVQSPKFQPPASKSR